MNEITLENWYDQPIHCPFCGEAPDPISEKRCKHLLYIIGDGNFYERSARFNELLGDTTTETDPAFGYIEKSRFGKPYEVATRIRTELPVHVEFQIVDPNDIFYIGFAALDEELCAWGHHHQSPYEK